MKAISYLAFACAMAQTFPQAEISNGQVRAVLYLPDAERGYYRATRFDWAGVIASLEYQGHSYFGQWFDKYDPKLHDAIMGPVEEFLSGNTLPGYDTAKPGDGFLRIGVGILRKPDEPQFRRFNTYDIADGGAWTVKQHAASVNFVHTLRNDATGYAYEYSKTVSLTKGKPQMVIEHTLRNTGALPITTDVYDHNFLVIDRQTTGPDIHIRFPFKLTGTRDLKKLAELRGTEIAFLKEFGPADRAQTELKGFGTEVSDYDVRFENTKTGAAVRVTGDRPLSKVVFWSADRVVSAEPYISMTIAPGSRFTWKIQYDFYTLPGK